MKLFCNNSSKPSLAAILRLPIRNWNGICKHCNSYHARILRLPIRNWNIVRGILWPLENLILRLPIRNWNPVVQGRPGSMDQILRLPIRNWNYHFGANRTIATGFWDYLSGIETLLLSGDGRQLLKNFEITYQELKQFDFTKRHKIAINFEITYQELKLLTINFRCKRIFQFWDYLSGIETLPVKNRNCWTPSFWDYLSGIETFFYFFSIYLSGQILRLPIRNWNMRKLSPRLRISYILRLPIRNWNWVPEMGIGWLQDFETTYQELKPGKTH